MGYSAFVNATQATTKIVKELRKLYMKPETKAHIERIVGKSIQEICSMDFDEEVRHVESKTNKPLRFSKKSDPRMRARGNNLIVRNRFCTMEDVDKKIEGLR